MAEENKKSKSDIIAVITLGVVPFIITLARFFQKSKDLNAPATMKDLLIILGVQAAIACVLAAKMFFFNYSVLR